MATTPSKVAAKKAVSKTLDNAVTKTRAFLLNLENPKLKNDFDRTLDRVKRALSQERGENANRNYPVDLAANYRVVTRMLNPIEVHSTAELENYTRDDLALSTIGAKIGDALHDLLKNELPVIQQLDETEMERGFYLGQDCTPEPK